MNKQLILALTLLSIACFARAENDANGNRPAPSSPETAAVSSNDNYVGDCFRVYIPSDSTSGSTLTPGWYLTLSQHDDNLKLLKVKSPLGVICSAQRPEVDEKGNPVIVEAKATDLFAYRALRTGWTYGVLVLPYKYHLDDKSFSGETTIGPYIGRRSTLGDIGYTWAMTAGFTPVSVESIDQSGNKKSTQLSAFSYAIGLIFELNKGLSPFQAGIFFGRDVVSSDSAVTYNHDRKNWLAFQLGWDFSK